MLDKFTEAQQPKKNAMKAFSSNNRMPPAMAPPVFRVNKAIDAPKQQKTLTMLQSQSRVSLSCFPRFVDAATPMVASTRTEGTNPTMSARAGLPRGGDVLTASTEVPDHASTHAWA